MMRSPALIRSTICGHPLESLQELRLYTVSESNPDKAGCTRPERQVQEVLFFAGKNSSCRMSVMEAVLSRAHAIPTSRAWHAIAASGLDPMCQLGGQLVVHEELHEAFRIG